MTIDKMIERLQAIGRSHSGDTRVYFDCPHCGIAYEPSVAVTKALHLTSGPERVDSSRAAATGPERP